MIVVVGFDGSEPTYRALEAATRLISGRVGRIEIVYVSHMPLGAEMSADAQLASRTGFDAAEHEFADALGARLAGIEERWRFQRRDGPIAHELVAAAEELSRDHVDANVVIVVGSAMHSYHHVVGSVPVALVRHARYPVMVVP